MKLLLDENLPVKLKHRFVENGINAFTTKDMKWLGKENGELLQEMMDNDFTIFITIDNNLSFQNNFIKYPINVVVLLAPDNTYETIMEFFSDIINVIKHEFKSPVVIAHPNFQG
jgi:predicted nuclease of predicted toxin-antitoxin system